MMRLLLCGASILPSAPGGGGASLGPRPAQADVPKIQALALNPLCERRATLPFQPSFFALGASGGGSPFGEPGALVVTSTSRIPKSVLNRFLDQVPARQHTGQSFDLWIRALHRQIRLPRSIRSWLMQRFGWLDAEGSFASPVDFQIRDGSGFRDLRPADRLDRRSALRLAWHTPKLLQMAGPDQSTPPKARRRRPGRLLRISDWPGGPDAAAAVLIGVGLGAAAFGCSTVGLFAAATGALMSARTPPSPEDWLLEFLSDADAEAFRDFCAKCRLMPDSARQLWEAVRAERFESLDDLRAALRDLDHADQKINLWLKALRAGARSRHEEPGGAPPTETRPAAPGMGDSRDPPAPDVRPTVLFIETVPRPYDATPGRYWVWEKGKPRHTAVWVEVRSWIQRSDPHGVEQVALTGDRSTGRERRFSRREYNFEPGEPAAPQSLPAAPPSAARPGGSLEPADRSWDAASPSQRGATGAGPLDVGADTAEETGPWTASLRPRASLSKRRAGASPGETRGLVGRSAVDPRVAVRLPEYVWGLIESGAAGLQTGDFPEGDSGQWPVFNAKGQAVAELELRAQPPDADCWIVRFETLLAGAESLLSPLVLGVATRMGRLKNKAQVRVGVPAIWLPRLQMGSLRKANLLTASVRHERDPGWMLLTFDLSHRTPGEATNWRPYGGDRIQRKATRLWAVATGQIPPDHAALASRPRSESPPPLPISPMAAAGAATGGHWSDHLAVIVRAIRRSGGGLTEPFPSSRVPENSLDVLLKEGFVERASVDGNDGLYRLTAPGRSIAETVHPPESGVFYGAMPVAMMLMPARWLSALWTVVAGPGGRNFLFGHAGRWQRLEAGAAMAEHVDETFSLRPRRRNLAARPLAIAA